MKTDAKCSDGRLGGLLEGYFGRCLTPTDCQSFRRHLEECLLCSAKVGNRENIEAAMAYYDITREQVLTNAFKATKQMNLVIVDLSKFGVGRPTKVKIH